MSVDTREKLDISSELAAIDHPLSDMVVRYLQNHGMVLDVGVPEENRLVDDVDLITVTFDDWYTPPGFLDDCREATGASLSIAGARIESVTGKRGNVCQQVALALG